MRIRHWVAYAILLLVSAVTAAEPLPELAAIALFKDKALISVDGKRKTFTVGADPINGVRLLAANAQVARVEVNGRQIELYLNNRITTKYREAPTEILRLAPGEGGHYYVDGAINGNPVAFLIDTGATQIAINKHTAKKLGLLYRTDGRPGEVETASGLVGAYYMTFNNVRIRNLTLNNVNGVVVDSDYPSVALLGQSFLNQLDLRRDGLLLELRQR